MRTRGIGSKILSERRHSLMQFANDSVGAIATQHLRPGHRSESARLVAVSKDEFPSLERLLLRVGAGNSASLDGRMTDAIFEPERLLFVRQRVTVLPPDHFDSRQLFVRVPRAVEHVAEALRIGR